MIELLTGIYFFFKIMVLKILLCLDEFYLKFTEIKQPQQTLPGNILCKEVVL